MITSSTARRRTLPYDSGTLWSRDRRACRSASSVTVEVRHLDVGHVVVLEHEGELDLVDREVDAGDRLGSRCRSRLISSVSIVPKWLRDLAELVAEVDDARDEVGRDLEQAIVEVAGDERDRALQRVLDRAVGQLRDRAGRGSSASGRRGRRSREMKPLTTAPAVPGMFVAMSKSLVSEYLPSAVSGTVEPVSSRPASSTPPCRRRRVARRSRPQRGAEEERHRRGCVFMMVRDRSAARVPRRSVHDQRSLRSWLSAAGYSASRACSPICGRWPFDHRRENRPKKPDPGDHSPGRPAILDARAHHPLRRTVYMRAPLNVAAASGAGVPA